MSINIKDDPVDYHLQYLGINAPYIDETKPCGGHFYKRLEKLGVIELPYKLKVFDFIQNDETFYELMVELPEEYFQRWGSYPIPPIDFEHPAGSYCFDFKGSINNKLELLHPYETSLLNSFVNQYKVKGSKVIEPKTHPNGKNYRNCEYYLSYWRAYVFFELNMECKFIGKYLPEQEGKEIVKGKYIDINNKWLKYGATFGRLAAYQSAMSKLDFFSSSFSCNYADLSLYLLEHMSASKEDLLEDMEKLLTIHYRWMGQCKSSGLSNYTSD
ncbi:hypothetical protein [Marinomonas sp. GJ51-6]|uniref:hypothetical protein n=1 Tax=Marinomonas sp. GJ51-6 TaxID=2992802 RepID=UPI0029351CEE|nr:hypothetical protein [Marinomonas sp. GJ51-6]WOD08735.1 hypothetical protein ONZ50_06580 [Marinomonas sp. GJ51-6]